VRSSIFAQYALLILTDFCTKGYFSKDDEEFAIRISDGKMRWGHLSLYAVSKVSYCAYTTFASSQCSLVMVTSYCKHPATVKLHEFKAFALVVIGELQPLVRSLKQSRRASARVDLVANVVIQ
jgi:hypothetical protein